MKSGDYLIDKFGKGAEDSERSRTGPFRIMNLRFSALAFLTVLTLTCTQAELAPAERNGRPESGDLFLEPSSTTVPGGKASLTISVLTRQAETYTGDYQCKVSPYFFKSEHGKLAIDVPDETLKKLASGMTVDFTGLATPSSKDKPRPVTGTATPVNLKQGSVSFRFVAANRELLFKTSYRFDDPAERPR
jgi:hypothetical protein